MSRLLLCVHLAEDVDRLVLIVSGPGIVHLHNVAFQFFQRLERPGRTRVLQGGEEIPRVNEMDNRVQVKSRSTLLTVHLINDQAKIYHQGGQHESRCS